MTRVDKIKVVAACGRLASMVDCTIKRSGFTREVLCVGTQRNQSNGEYFMYGVFKDG